VTNNLVKIVIPKPQLLGDIGLKIRMIEQEVHGRLNALDANWLGDVAEPPEEDFQQVVVLLGQLRVLLGEHAGQECCGLCGKVKILFIKKQVKKDNDRLLTQPFSIVGGQQFIFQLGQH